MNTRRLITLGFAGLFLFLAVTALLVAGNSPQDDVTEPAPVRAPAPVVVQASTVAAPPEAVVEAVSQPAPQPEPVRVAPGREDQAPIAGGTPSVSAGILLLMLVGSTLVLTMGLLVGRQPAAERPDRRPRLAEGVRA
jgi:hypothetical protein